MWGVTEVWLKVTNAPTDLWFDIFASPDLTPNNWIPVNFAQPWAGLGTSEQTYVVYLSGNPPQSFFRAIAHADSDSDGLLDSVEICLFKSDPNNPDSAFLQDSDGDGTADFANAGGNNIADGDEDFDGDGLSNLFEMELGTNPLIAQSSTDTDADGLPDWVEEMITIYTGDPDPAPGSDSDGDGLDNYTEWTMRMDPSWPDPILQDYSMLPDHQRAIQDIRFSLMRDGSPSSSQGEHSMLANFSGIGGTAGTLAVLKDEMEDGTPLAGTDTFAWSAAYQTPPVPTGWESTPLPDSSNGGLEWSDVLLDSTELLGDTWKEARVSENLHSLARESLVHLQYRSTYRIWAQVRRMQIIQTAIPMPQGILLRTKRALASIHTEATILRHVHIELNLRFPWHNAFANCGSFVIGTGKAASVWSAGSTAVNYVYPFGKDYIRDVGRRCDGSGESAALLAYALAYMADDLLPAPGTVATMLWSVWWQSLSNFDGYDSSCW